MCSTPKPDNTASRQAQREADEARQKEEQRQQQLATGRANIDRIFATGDTYNPGRRIENPAYAQWEAERREIEAAGWGALFPDDGPPPPRYIEEGGSWSRGSGGYDDAFFARRRQDVEDWYRPQLQRQFDDAKRTMLFQLADQGITNSTEAHRQQNRLAEAFQVESANLATRAAQAETSLRGEIDKSKADLIAQLQATSDPDGVAAAATARSQTLASAPTPTDTLGDVFAGLLNSGAAIYAGRQNYATNQAVNNALAPQSARPSRGTTLSR